MPLVNSLLMLTKPQCLLRFIGLLGLCRFAVAQAVVDPSMDAVYTLPSMTVNAWRFETLDLDYAADVTVIDRNAIESAGGLTLPDLLLREANVRFDSFNGKSTQAQVSLRGFGENSGLRVLVVVDGQRINRPDMGQIEWQQIPLNWIERVEVIRGGNNVLYGQYALSGVIQITTLRGGEPETKVTLEGGNDGFALAKLSHTGSAGAWYWNAHANYTWDSGYREHSNTRNHAMSTKLGHYLDEARTKSLTFSASVSDTYSEYPGTLTFQQFLANPRQSIGNDGSDDLLTGLFSTLWEGEHSWGKSYFNASLSTRELRSDAFGNISDNDQYSVTLAPRLTIGNDQQFIIGGMDILFDKVDFEIYYQERGGLEDSRANLDLLTIGPYLFAQKDLSDNLILSGGARYEVSIGNYLNEQFATSQYEPFIETNRGTFPNPDFQIPADIVPGDSFNERVVESGMAAEISLLWKATDSLSIWAGYDRAYRFPVLDETASYQGLPLNTPINTMLDPETGNQFDLGIKYRKGRWNASATSYYLGLENEIIFDNSQGIGGQNVNFDATRRIGADLLLEYDAGKWGASTQWAFADAQFTEGQFSGKRIPLVPRAHSVTNTWIAPLDWLNLSVFYSYFTNRYQGSDFDNANPTLDSYGRIDCKASATFGDLTMYARIDNLADKSEAPYAVLGGYYPAPGRQWRLGLSYTF